MKHDHPPILVLAITALLVLLSIAGGPIVFALLVMASPLIMIMIFAARAVFHGGGGMSHTEYQRRDARRGGGFTPDKT